MTEKTILNSGEFLLTDTGNDDVFTPEDFTTEQRQIAETTEQFVAGEVLPQLEEIDRRKFEITVNLMKRCGELGLLMMDAPEAEGGLELDKATGMLVAEKMGAAGSFSVVYMAHSGLATLPLLYYGNTEQKKRYLEKIISGEWVAAFCLTEPDAGSDALTPRTSAVLSEDGTHYILNGTKQFITNAAFSGLFTVVASVDKKETAVFLVERDFPGVTIGPEEEKMGIKGSSTCQVILDGVKVPKENLLGDIGKGHKIALNALNIGRLKLGAAVMGLAKHAFSHGVKYANERKQFGKTIGSFGAIKEKIADMAALIFASESVVFRLAGMLDAKAATLAKDSEGYDLDRRKVIAEYSTECAIAKVFCSEVMARVADEVVAIFGGYGYTHDYPAERFYRDERINRIYEGTNEINRLVITGMVLRKAMKGKLPLQKEAVKAFESLMTPSFEEADESLPFPREKALVRNLKTLFLVIAGAAAQKFSEKLSEEEEILIAAADLMIQVFALESAVLRAEKHYGAASEKRKSLLKATLQVFAFHAAERAEAAGKRAAFYVETGDTLTMILSGVRRFTKYDASGLLISKRLLADASLEAEKYLL